MASFNSVTLVGRLGRDPELKYLPSGSAVVDFAIAVSDRIKRGEQWVEETSWVDVTFFGRTAEICNEYLAKGSECLVSGRLRQESWEKDGQKRSKLKVIGDKMQMFGGKSDRQPQREPAAVSSGGGEVDGDPFDQEVPF